MCLHPKHFHYIFKKYLWPVLWLFLSLESTKPVVVKLFRFSIQVNKFFFKLLQFCFEISLFEKWTKQERPIALQLALLTIVIFIWLRSVEGIVLDCGSRGILHWSSRQLEYFVLPLHIYQALSVNNRWWNYFKISRRGLFRSYHAKLIG